MFLQELMQTFFLSATIYKFYRNSLLVKHPVYLIWFKLKILSDAFIFIFLDTALNKLYPIHPRLFFNCNSSSLLFEQDNKQSPVFIVLYFDRINFYALIHNTASYKCPKLILYIVAFEYLLSNLIAPYWTEFLMHFFSAKHELLICTIYVYNYIAF